jgi:tRNA threonylcarbamoyl adenosine modification protein YeaZ/ribosomal-protein-alanine acetyltransferase
MIILGLDTSMAACSVAVIDSHLAIPLASSFNAMERGHAEALAPMVQQVMASAALPFSSIERIAVTIGPGTFTGVRIGLAMARGLGLARGLPVIGIDSLSAIAANEVTSDSFLLVAADARNGEVYTASFDPRRQMVGPPTLVPAKLATKDLPPSSIVIGTAAVRVIAESGRNDLVLSHSGNVPDAALFSSLAVDVKGTGNMPSPLYLRAPDAKPQAAPLRRINALKFVNATPAFASVLSTIHSEAFETGWSGKSFTELLATPGSAAVVAMEHDKPVAFTLTRQAADEAEIITVCTRPSAQRRGAAKALLFHHFTELRRAGVKHVFIEVARFNVAARALYASLGFTEAGLRRNYYKHADGSTEDAIVMRRELAS